MADTAREAADKELKKMEKYLSELYKQAGKDLEAKAVKYMADFARLEAQHKKDVESGKWTQDEFDEWRKNKLLYGQHWTRLIQDVQKEMANCNRTAIDYMNGKATQVYADSYNSLQYAIENSDVRGYSFELVDADTVKNLAEEDGIILPPKKNLDEQKDKLWNAKQVNAQILQGVLQGESIPKIAARMQNVANADLVGATRTARTMITAAENSGRQSGMNRAEQDGIEFWKMWIATSDERTRESHNVLNGQCIPNGEMFVTIDGEELEFPGDWRADGSEVYNCRCSLGTIVKGFNNKKSEEQEADPEAEEHQEEVQKEQPEERQPAKIGGLSSYPEKHQREILRLLDNAPVECVNAWNNVCDKFKTITGKEYKEITGVKATGAFYCPELQAVYLNIKTAAEGGGYKAPYQTLFHEYGHFIDYIMNVKFGDGKSETSYTAVKGDGAFNQKIAEEAEKAIEKFGRENGFSTSLTESELRRQWNSNAELRNSIKIADYIKENIGKDSIDRDATEKAFIEYIKSNNSLVARSDLSDMFEASFRTTAYPFDVGHGRDYWTRNVSARGKEAFAEMFSAKVANPEAWELMKTYFPESVEMFEEMLKELN